MLQFKSEDLDKRDARRRRKELLCSLSGLGRFLSAEEMNESLKFERKRKFINDYIDSELLPYLKDSPAFNRDLIIHGFFKGIKFDKIENVQAGIAQKLLGVYEVELKEHLESLSSNKYDFIINIGAAEGLYSIAFEKIWPDCPVYSFEEDYHTRELLRKMCTLNNCKNIVVLEQFNLSSLENIDSNKRGLIFSDCEGFEAKIFTVENLKKLRNCDLIIETHDHNAPGVTDALLRDLVHTHAPQEKKLLSFAERATLVDDEVFKNLDPQLQQKMMDSSRNPLNRWVVALALL